MFIDFFQRSINMLKFKKWLAVLCAAVSCFCLGIGVLIPAKAAESKYHNLVDFVVEVESGRDIKVLQLSDPQIINADQKRYAFRGGSDAWAEGKQVENHEKYVTQVIEAYDPDLIIITGDIVYGEFDDSGKEFLRYVEFMDSFEIPWAPIFGNHDNESNMGVDWQCEQFENAEYCLFKQRTLTGNGNYSIGLVQNDELKRVFFMMDSNGCVAASALSRSNGHTKTSFGFGDDQIEWYTDAVHAIKNVEPNVKLSFAFHVQLQVFAEAFAKYIDGGYPVDIDTHVNKAESDFGYIGATPKTPWDTDYKVWDGLKALGVDSIFVGHEHYNSASIVYEGIRLQYGQKSSTYDRYNTFNGQPCMGGTAIPVSETDGSIVNPYIVYYQEPVSSAKKIEFDFNGTDFDMTSSWSIATNVSAVTENIPEGYADGVYAVTTDNLSNFGVKLPSTVDASTVTSFKVRMYVKSHGYTSQPWLRLYGTSSTNLCNLGFRTYGGVYDQWVEIEFLSAINKYGLIDGEKFNPLSIVYRAYGTEETTIYFDSIIIEYQEKDVVDDNKETEIEWAREMAYGVYDEQVYNRYTVSDFEKSGEIDFSTDAIKTYLLGNHGYTYAFSTIAKKDMDITVGMLSDENGKNSVSFEILFTGIKVHDKQFDYAFSANERVNIELGLAVMEYNSNTGAYNGNTGYVFAKVNSSIIGWKLIELYKYKGQCYLYISSTSGSTLESYNSVRYVTADGTALMKEISCEPISVTEEKLAYYAENNAYSQVVVNGESFSGTQTLTGSNIAMLYFENQPTFDGFDENIPSEEEKFDLYKQTMLYALQIHYEKYNAEYYTQGNYALITSYYIAAIGDIQAEKNSQENVKNIVDNFIQDANAVKDILKTINAVDWLDSEYVLVESGYKLLGDVGQDTWYRIKLRLTIPNIDNYDIRFYLNGDGATSANGVMYGGEGSFRIYNGRVWYGYPGAWHMPYVNMDAGCDSIVKGNTITLEMGVYGLREGKPVWFVAVDEAILFTVADKAFDVFLGKAGTYAAMHVVNGTAIISSVENSCAHKIQAKDEQTGCMKVTEGCIYCDLVTKYISAHTYQIVGAISPTCDKDGIIEHRCCEICGAIADLNGKPLSSIEWNSNGHSYHYHYKVEPTYEIEGTDGYYSCDGCDLIFDRNKNEISEIPTLPKLSDTSSGNALDSNSSSDSSTNDEQSGCKGSIDNGIGFFVLLSCLFIIQKKKQNFI